MTPRQEFEQGFAPELAYDAAEEARFQIEEHLAEQMGKLRAGLLPGYHDAISPKEAK